MDAPSRRAFLRLSTTAAGGLLLSFAPGDATPSRTRDKNAFRPNPFLQIDPDGTVHIWAPRADVGQGTRTSLPMLVAEELEAEWSHVRVWQADLNPEAFGEQDVGGSDSIPASWTRLREAGAVGRELLIRAAAESWNVSPTECVACGSIVSHASSGRRGSYGSLASAASHIPLPKNAVPLKSCKDYRLIGTRVGGVDNSDIVAGAAIFGIDVVRPGMRYAAIARCPSGGKFVSCDESAARQYPGVRRVLRIEGLEQSRWLRAGIAVIAESTWAAIKGRDALRVVWDRGVGADLTSERIRATLRESARAAGTAQRQCGDVDAALSRSSRAIDVEYEIPLLAHVPMEPMNCTAHVADGRCDVWGPIQMPESARTNVARATGMAKETIAIHPTRIGGSFGRRLASDYAAEAAYLSKVIAEPVQVIWTRGDDLEHDFYRPAAYHRIRACISDDGAVAWRHRVVTLADSMYPTSTGIAGLMAPRSANLRADLNDDLIPCLVASYRLESSTVKLPAETGSLRAPGHNANAFAVNSVLDELAHASGVDPVALRLQLLGTKAQFPYEGRYSPAIYNPDRLKGVLNRVAAVSRWGHPLSTGCGRGIAAHYTNGSYAAHVMEIEVDAERVIRIRRVVAVIDCGLPVNRSGIEAQLEGGTIDALSAAMFGEVTIENGRAKQRNFDTYRWMRNKEAPVVEMVIVESDENPTGMGESPYPPVAPALTNAIFQATGDRIRRLPLSNAGYKLKS